MLIVGCGWVREFCVGTSRAARRAAKRKASRESRNGASSRVTASVPTTRVRVVCAVLSTLFGTVSLCNKLQTQKKEKVIATAHIVKRVTRNPAPGPPRTPLTSDSASNRVKVPPKTSKSGQTPRSSVRCVHRLGMTVRGDLSS
eukprot:scaffold113891_cov69-Phaeocystis_antarctica.AAC.1